jgi:hypothetical protein
MSHESESMQRRFAGIVKAWHVTEETKRRRMNHRLDCSPQTKAYAILHYLDFVAPVTPPISVRTPERHCFGLPADERGRTVPHIMQGQVVDYIDAEPRNHNCQCTRIKHTK